MKTKAELLDIKAKQLAKHLLRAEAEVLSTLMEMNRARVFAELNYSGVFDYCLRALNFSREQAYYFKRVAEVSVVVPQLKEAITEGQLSLSSARRIAPILNPANQREWIERAKVLKQTELEKAVTEANPQAHPRERVKPVAKNVSELRVAIDDETEANLSCLRDLLSQKLRRPATLADVVAWAAREARERFDPERKAARAKKRNEKLGIELTALESLAESAPNSCEDSEKKARRPISSGNRSAKVVGQRHRRPLPAKVRHELFHRTGLRCTYVSPDLRRCEQRRWLDLHHRVPVAKGGANETSNLTLLCKAHHRALHDHNNAPTLF